MTFSKSAKIIAASILVVGFSSTTALAGDKAKCDKKNHTAMQKTAVSTPTMVLPATAKKAGYPAKTTAKTMTFDQALELCQAKGAADLQGCIDMKTGQAKPKS